MAEITKETIEVKEPVKSYEVKDNILEVVETPQEIVPVIKTYNIEEVLARIEKNKNARDQWQALIDADQAIVDLYNSNK